MEPLVLKEVLDHMVHKDLEVKMVREVSLVIQDLLVLLEKQVDVVWQETLVL